MICKNCGGQLPEGSRVCGFCETEVEGANTWKKSAPTELEIKMAELLTGVQDTSCGGGCTGCGAAQEEESPTWWKEDSCGSCGGGLTGADKDLKYALAIVGLIVGIIVFALVAKTLIGLF